MSEESDSYSLGGRKDLSGNSHFETEKKWLRPALGRVKWRIEVIKELLNKRAALPSEPASFRMYSRFTEDDALGVQIKWNWCIFIVMVIHNFSMNMSG